MTFDEMEAAIPLLEPRERVLVGLCWEAEGKLGPNTYKPLYEEEEHWGLPMDDVNAITLRLREEGLIGTNANRDTIWLLELGRAIVQRMRRP